MMLDMNNLTRESFDLMDLTVKDVGGSKIGDVTDFYFDTPTGQVEWLVVGAGMANQKSLLVPVEGITRDGDDLIVAYEKGLVQDAPPVEAESIDFETETALYRHFNMRREPPGRTEDKPPWQQADSVARPHRLRLASASEGAIAASEPD